MYLGVRLTTLLSTGEEKVRFSIPASLIPVIQYSVTKKMEENGDVLTNVEKTQTYPVHLFYEVGLDEQINKYDWSKVEDYQFENQLTESLRECKFYTNAWDLESGNSYTDMKFEPSEKNEFYYYTENSPIYKKKEGSENEYIPCDEEKRPDDRETYYYEKVIYGKSGEENNSCWKKSCYVEIDERDLQKAVQENGVWNIPKGTLKMNSVEERVEKQQSINGVGYVRSSSILEKTYEKNEGTVINTALGNNAEYGFKQGKVCVGKEVKDGEYAEGHGPETKFDFKMTLSSKPDAQYEFSLKDGEKKTYWFPLEEHVLVEEVGIAASKYITSVTIGKDKLIQEDVKKGEVVILEEGSIIMFSNSRIVETADLKMRKVGEEGESLKGAVFHLYKCSEKEPYPPDDPTSEDYEEAYEKYEQELEKYKQHIETEHNKVFDEKSKETTCWELVDEKTSGVVGEFVFKELNKDDYRLIETVAPSGYMKPVGQWNVRVVPSGDVKFTFLEVTGEGGIHPPAIEDTEAGYRIRNYKPINPPVTGGRGIDRFLIMGATVAVGGLMITVHLVLQRKRGKL